MFNYPTNIIQILTKIYPSCRVACTKCRGTLEEQFNHLVWNDEDTTGNNPNPKPTWGDIASQIDFITLKNAQDTAWEFVKIKRNQICDSGVIYNGIPYDSDSNARQSLVLSATNGDIQYNWTDANNNVQLLSRTDIANIQSLIAKLCNLSWKNSQTLHSLIYNYNNIQDVNNFMINILNTGWASVPFTNN